MRGGGVVAGGFPRAAGTGGFSVVDPAGAGGSTDTGNFRRGGGSGRKRPAVQAGAAAGVRACTFEHAGAATAQIPAPTATVDMSACSEHQHIIHPPAAACAPPV